MAKDDQDLELDIETEASSGKSKLILIIAVVVVLLGGGIAAFFIFSGDSTEDATAEETTEPVKEPAQYVGVPEAITSNIPGESRNRTVQIKMSFMVRGDKAVETVKKHMPQLKNDVLMLVSQQSADQLETPEGRKLLQEQALKTVQTTLTGLVGEPTVEKVLFISFLMQ